MKGFQAVLAAAAAAVAAALALGPSTAGAQSGHEQSRPPSRSVPAGAQPSKTSKMCGVCHAEVRVKYEKGVHQSEGIGCVSCHGGNPNALTVETAHGAGFRGVPARRAIPELCASCHADVAKMRFFNLPSDQYALYRTSQHGLKLARGDDGVAVCTDCHGVHEIRPRSDPQSSVFGRNIATTCGKCHGNTAFLKRRSRPDNPVADYHAGVHGKAYLAGGNDAAPECTRCHGSHGATPPGVGDVQKVCGQCHTKPRMYFLGSPHRDVLDQTHQEECIACHKNHGTEAATPALFGTVCKDCHEPGDPALHVAATFARKIREATVEIAQADTLVLRASRIPLYVEDYRSRLEDARTALVESAPVTHSLDSALVEPYTRRARSIAAEVSREIQHKLSERVWHKVGLGLFWFYLLLTAAVIVRARRRAGREPDR
jgi:predicted CXXCH cytochrome family protein